MSCHVRRAVPFSEEVPDLSIEQLGKQKIRVNITLSSHHLNQE